MGKGFSWGYSLDSEYGAMWQKEHNAYVGKNACDRLMMAVKDKLSNANWELKYYSFWYISLPMKNI